MYLCYRDSDYDISGMKLSIYWN